MSGNPYRAAHLDGTASWYFLLLISLLLCKTAFAQKQVWISPNFGVDFLALFDENAPWPEVRSKIHVFSTHENLLGGRQNLEQRIVPFIQRTGIQLALEVGGLRSFLVANLAPGHPELVGELTAEDELQKMALITTRGGTITYLHMDSPIGYTLASAGDEICAFEPPQAASELADYMEAVRQIYPDMRFVLIEPVPWYRVGGHPAFPGQDRGDLIDILQIAVDTLAAHGLRLEAFHADNPFGYTDWRRRGYDGLGKLVQLQNWVQARGIRFGLISNDDLDHPIDYPENSDSLFFSNTLRSYDQFVAAGGNPDNLPVMSWYPYPQQALPEEQPYTFTYLVKEMLARVDSTTTSVHDDNGRTSASFSLHQNYPNPFNPVTKIRFSLARRMHVTLKIFDARGREQRVLVNGARNAGEHTIALNAEDLTTGIYFCQLQASDFSGQKPDYVRTKKLILLK
jgi:hypothetical protein